MNKLTKQTTGLLGPSGSAARVMIGAARAGAVGGAIMALGVTLVTGIAARKNPERSRDDLVREGFAEVGTSAMLGAVGGLSAAVTGVGVAAVLGRSVLTLVLPTLVGTMVAAAVREPAHRASRRFTDQVVDGIAIASKRPGVVPILAASQLSAPTARAEEAS
ncbi:MAG: hypothetical protein PVG38_09580 [Gammaproteobacteria bacterium]|jgi:hypothetical protein